MCVLKCRLTDKTVHHNQRAAFLYNAIDFNDGRNGTRVTQFADSTDANIIFPTETPKFFRARPHKLTNFRVFLAKISLFHATFPLLHAFPPASLPYPTLQWPHIEAVARNRFRATHSSSPFRRTFFSPKAHLFHPFCPTIPDKRAIIDPQTAFFDTK
jgi:hypothetical protein